MTSPAAQDCWPVDAAAYTFMGKIGQGAFASVWKASVAVGGGEGGEEAERKKECAIKILNLDNVDMQMDEIRREVHAMLLSSHENVLKAYTSFVYHTDLWLVTELMNKGSALHCLEQARKHQKLLLRIEGERNPIDYESHITYIIHETLLGLKYIHDNGQIHRDIKAGNILLNQNGDVRIADFGVSGWLVHGGKRRENTKTFVGTPCWMAPEVMEQIHGYDYKADIWSLGITTLELAKGYAPYAKYPPMKVLLLTMQEDPPSLDTYDDSETEHGEEEPVEFSRTFRSMLSQCLQKKPVKRPTCQELLNKHFKEFSDSNYRLQKRQMLAQEVCSLVKDVGGDGTIMLKTEEDRQPGTTWVFSDGSQEVTKATAGPKEKEADDSGGDFFDEFEQQTGGEHFSAKRKAEKEEINDFLDDFENTTAGEHFRRQPP